MASDELDGPFKHCVKKIHILADNCGWRKRKFPFVCLSVCFSLCLSVRLSVCLYFSCVYVCLFVYMFVCLSVCVFLRTAFQGVLLRVKYFEKLRVFADEKDLA